MGFYKRRTHTCAEDSMRVTLSGFEKCNYPPWLCRADFTSPEASCTGLSDRAVSTRLCLWRQMTASISHHTTSSGRPLRHPTRPSPDMVYQPHAGAMPTLKSTLTSTCARLLESSCAMRLRVPTCSKFHRNRRNAFPLKLERSIDGRRHIAAAESDGCIWSCTNCCVMC